jgi:hypothetical protein
MGYTTTTVPLLDRMNGSASTAASWSWHLRHGDEPASS